MNFSFASVKPVIQYEDGPQKKYRSPILRFAKAALPYTIIVGLLVATFLLH